MYPLKPCAFAPDGLIEGVEGRNGQYLIAVQWHPEELADTHAPMQRLFTDFVAVAGTVSISAFLVFALDRPIEILRQRRIKSGKHLNLRAADSNTAAPQSA